MSGKEINFQTDGTGEVDKDKLSRPAQDHMISGGADSAPIDLVGTKEEGVFQRKDFELAPKKVSHPREGRRE